MFSVARLTRLERPCPPTPTAATLRRSLGAVWPRPSTWRGTIAKPAPVSATSETKSRRVIFFVIVVLRSAKASAERPLAYRLGATTKLGKRANPDVAKREHAGVISLHADVAALGAAE